MSPDDVHAFSATQYATLTHTYHRHPLFQVPALADLARELMPLKLCRFPVGGMTQSSAFNLRSDSDDGRSIDQLFARIDQPGSWIALYDVEVVPRYRDLLARIIDHVRAPVEAQEGRILLVTGFIFISAPPSVTPYHIDRENNFWLQLHGRKNITVWNNADRTLLPVERVENFIVNRSLAGVTLQDEQMSRGTVFERGPGTGLYFPSTTPHATETTTGWVTPENPLSISIGINFYTAKTRRHAQVHQLNRFVRRFGINPVPPGNSPIRDRFKAPLGRALVIMRQRLRPDYEPPVGTL